MAERILTPREVQLQRVKGPIDNPTAFNEIIASHELLRAERDRLLAERGRLVAALHNLVKMPMMIHACSNVGDGCPVCRGREVLADAQQERT